MSVDNRIAGRLALVTGASGGIGAACARELAAEGCHIALTYSSHKEPVDDLIKEITTNFPAGQSLHLSSHKCDMSSIADIENLFTEIRAVHSQQGPDILISNAGRGKRIPRIEDIPLHEFEDMLRINLTASFLLTQKSVPHMRAQHWGRIIFMSSIAAYGGGINGCHYAASKGGLLSMGKNLATNLAKDGITVNDVAPAMIGETRMIPDAKFLEGTPGDVKGIPVGRLGTTKEVAEAVVMFARSGYTTGQSLLMTGGLK